jgi:DNA-directed RNA polymerase subunit RPC12/RpoP
MMINKCGICGKDLSGTKDIFRCSEHYRCDLCGTKNGQLIFRRRGLTCDACNKARAEKEIEAFDGDTDYTHEIVCPWCGYEQSDSWEASDEGDHICDNCLREYRHVREVEISYSTEKIVVEGE